MLPKILNSYKSFWPGQVLVETELPVLTVITGQNGSGKSQLLEAMQTGMVQPDGGVIGSLPRLLTSVELQSVAASNQFPPREQLLANLRNAAEQYAGDPLGLGSHLATYGHLTASQVMNAELASGKSIGLWSDNDWVRYTPLEGAGGDLFRFSLGELFSIYNQARTVNQFTQWLAETHSGPGDFLTHEEFLVLHGEPPWVVMTRALETIGLPYFFESPVASVSSEHTEPRMVDKLSGRAVRAEELGQVQMCGVTRFPRDSWISRR